MAPSMLLPQVLGGQLEELPEVGRLMEWQNIDRAPPREVLAHPSLRDREPWETRLGLS